LDIILDGEYDQAQNFISKTIFPRLDDILAHKLWQDSKSFFQEKSQEIFSITPGPDHNKKFTVGVFLDKELIAQGAGRSKQEAEQDAARNALGKKGWS